MIVSGSAARIQSDGGAYLVSLILVQWQMIIRATPPTRPQGRIPDWAGKDEVIGTCAMKDLRLT